MLIYIRNGREFFLKDKTIVILYGITVNPLNRIFSQVKICYEKRSKLFFLLSFDFLLLFPFLLLPSAFSFPLFCFASEKIMQKNK